MLLFLTPLSPWGLGERALAQQGGHSAACAYEHPHGQGCSLTCSLFAAPHSIFGSEPVHKMSLWVGSSPETLCRVGTCRVGSVMVQCGRSYVEGS